MKNVIIKELAAAGSTDLTKKLIVSYGKNLLLLQGEANGH